ncbi:M48 family metalloprotease [Francisellaceae bacterium]|nr:M48 family metalloprotease [Francisellaceae bacterium]
MVWRKVVLSTACSLLLCVQTHSQNIVLPNLGDAADGNISDNASRALGRNVLNQIKQYTPVVEDPLWQYYIEQLGKNLLSHSRDTDTHIEFILFNTNVINAFALPGQIIGIYSGLVLQSQYEGEVASVLAHEIAHVTQKHYERMVEKQSATLMKQMSGILASAALAMVDGRAASAALTSTLAAGHQSMIGYTRDHEYEADWIGVETLSKANYPESDMANFFNRLPKNTYHANLEALYTHPYPTKRASEALNRLQHKRRGTKHSILISQADFIFMKARLEVITSQHKKSLLFSTVNDNEVDKYKKSYINIVLNRNIQNTVSLLRDLYNDNPRSIVIVYTFIESLIIEHSYEEALAMINTAREQHFDILPLLILTVKLHQSQKDYKKAKNELLNINSDYPKYILAYKELAENEQKLGQPGVAHFFMAKYYYHIGMTDLAVVQLKLAQKQLQSNLYYLSQVRQLLSQWSR